MTKVQSFRCDRCGKVFTRDEGGEQSKIILHDHDIIWDKKPEDNTFDLCDDCVSSFYTWKENQKKVDEFFDSKNKEWYPEEV